MSDQALDLQALLAAVPTLELTMMKEDENRTVLLAGDEPVFRVRSNELGQAYSHLVIAALAHLSKALSTEEAAHAALLGGEPKNDLDEAFKTEVVSKIVQSLSMQAEHRSKAQLAGKLVYSAIEPYLRGSILEAGFHVVQPGGEAAPAIDVVGVRRDAVQDFSGWLAEGGRLGRIKNEQDLADLCGEWEELNA